jgi:hypothetical protein
MKRLAKRNVKRCIFCPNKADSKQHGWEQWTLRRTSFSPRTGIIGHVGSEFIHNPGQRAIRIRCVCEPCNTGWMKQIGEAVIPTSGAFMSDFALPLDIPQQWAIAQWAVMNAMVWECIAPEDQRRLFYTDEERAGLRISNAMPSFTAVWLSRHTAGFHNRISAADVWKTVPDRIEPVHGYVTTLAYRYLAVQIFTLRAPQEDERGGTVVHCAPGPWPFTTMKVFPPSRIKRWPPRMTMDTTQALVDFSRRFSWGPPAPTAQ